MTKSKKNNYAYILGGLLLSFFILLLIKPESVLESGQKALELCLNIIIPSLFPFFVVSRLILNTGVIHTISRVFKPVIKPLFNLPGSAAFPIIAGWFSGYPAGAKYTVDLYEKEMLSQNEAQRLLAFCNNSGPLFIVGAVGTGYFQSPELGLMLLLSHLLASITIGIGAGLISRKKELSEKKTMLGLVEKQTKPKLLEKKTKYEIAEKKTKKAKFEPAEKQTAFNGKILSDAVTNSVMVLLQICGTIFFFAVAVQALETAGVFNFISKLVGFLTGSKNIYSEITEIFIAGSLEITYGLYILSRAISIPVIFKILLAALFCGFGGFSVHTQVTGLCPSHFKFKSYYTGKLLHGIIASVYTGLFLINRSIPVMKSSFSLHDADFSRVLLIIYALLLIFIILYIISIRRD
ncbi:MAG: nucleoside recognition domain-containing protein [Ruminiclostridium sp.]|nr:nucleoside recognition domain-containing protein [Ruminiclostridium sp.]